MISWIVASHQPEMLEGMCATIPLLPGDEFVVIENPTAITKAYNEGTARARNRLRCYLHHDVRVLDYPRLRQELLIRCTPNTGLAGVAGHVAPILGFPWGMHAVGSITETRRDLFATAGDEFCPIVDGVLLATVQEIEWDERYPGFHFYDIDACVQMVARGLPNWCLGDGRTLIEHYNPPNDPRPIRRAEDIPEWLSNLNIFKAKWQMLGVPDYLW